VNATFVVLDPAHGAVGLREQMASLIATTDACRVEVIDVGGDILGTGGEPELRSPLADALALAATADLPVPVEVLVAGPGLDGELSEEAVLARIDQLWGRRVMRVGHAEARWAMPLFDWHPSEATALLVAAGRGLRGDAEIRGGGHRVRLTDESPNVYALAHSDVLGINEPAGGVRETLAMGEVDDIVRAVCGRSEMDFERERAAEARISALASPDASAIAAAIEVYRREALRRGIEYVTFRRLAEVVGLNAAMASDLRCRLISSQPGQYTAPLWRLTVSRQNHEAL
jgi:hypothetical protein